MGCCCCCVRFTSERLGYGFIVPSSTLTLDKDERFSLHTLYSWLLPQLSVMFSKSRRGHIRTPRLNYRLPGQMMIHRPPREQLHIRHDLSIMHHRNVNSVYPLQTLGACSITKFHTAYPKGSRHCYRNALNEQRKKERP